jgi:hypothetical protein
MPWLLSDLAKPKAGQGMNTAFHDALNLAWKVHLVESGFALPSILASYEAERKEVAENLLNFDAKYATLFSKRRPSADEMVSVNSHYATTGEKNEFVDTFKAGCELTSGYGVAYRPNIFNWSPKHPARSPLFDIPGVKSIPGRAFIPCTVTRISDSNIVYLEQEIPVNGSFRIFIFAGAPLKTKKAIEDFSVHIKKDTSFLSAYSWMDIKNVSYFERHNPDSKFFTICLIYASDKSAVDMLNVPAGLRAYHQHVYADDVPDIRVPSAKHATYEKLGLDPDRGGVIVTRPDSHVACTVQLVEGSATVDALNAYFDGFSTKPLGQKSLQSRL